MEPFVIGRSVGQTVTWGHTELEEPLEVAQKKSSGWDLRVREGEQEPRIVTCRQTGSERQQGMCLAHATMESEKTGDAVLGPVLSCGSGQKRTQCQKWSSLDQETYCVSSLPPPPILGELESPPEEEGRWVESSNTLGCYWEED